VTREETLKVLSLLREAYPFFYSKTADIEPAVNLWHAIFSDDDSRLVAKAVMELISTHAGYPPDIATVKNKIRALISSVSGEDTDEELWHRLKRALSNGLYGAAEEFEKLPTVLKRYAGSPSTLRDMAEIDTETLNTVVHGQFLKQIAAVRERERAAASLSEPEKELIRMAGVKRLTDGA
jgi:hypothetical protein